MPGTSTTCTSIPSSTAWLIESAIGRHRLFIVMSNSETIHQTGLAICRNIMTVPISESEVDGAVGWVERSETHHRAAFAEPRWVSLRSTHPTRPRETRRAKHPQPRQSLLAKNIPLYRNSELRHRSRQPGLTKRGGSRVVRNAGRVAVDAAASARRVAGRAGSPCELVTACRRTALSAYGKTVWSWPSLLRSSSCGDVREPNRADGIVNSQGRGRPEGKFGSRESTA